MARRTHSIALNLTINLGKADKVGSSVKTLRRKRGRPAIAESELPRPDAMGRARSPIVRINPSPYPG